MGTRNTGADTEAFFLKQNYFGLDRANVHFFEQGVLPAFTMDGKIILEDRDKVSVAPDGNGGVYAALRDSGVLNDMEARGMAWLCCCALTSIKYCHFMSFTTRHKVSARLLRGQLPRPRS